MVAHAHMHAAAEPDMAYGIPCEIEAVGLAPLVRIGIGRGEAHHDLVVGSHSHPIDQAVDGGGPEQRLQRRKMPDRLLECVPGQRGIGAQGGVLPRIAGKAEQDVAQRGDRRVDPGAELAPHDVPSFCLRQIPVLGERVQPVAEAAGPHGFALGKLHHPARNAKGSRSTSSENGSSSRTGMASGGGRDGVIAIPPTLTARERVRSCRRGWCC